MVVASSISAPAKELQVGIDNVKYLRDHSKSLVNLKNECAISENSFSTRADDVPTDEAVVDKWALWRAIAAAGTGNFMEYYDLAIYGYVTTEVGKAFYSNSSSSMQRLEVFASMAVAFAARPLGALITGPLGDRIGRRRMLTYTVVITSLSTAMCGLIPTYNAIGYWSPVLLILFRLLQAGAASGEYAGAGTFIAEYAPIKTRGFYCSLSVALGYLGPITGSILNLILTSCSSDTFYEKYGWRILFVLGIPFGIVGLILRQLIEETPVYKQMEENQTVSKQPLRDVLTHRRSLWRILMGFCIASIETGAWFVMLTFMPSYLTETQNVDSTWTTVVLIFAQITAIGTIPIAGTLADRLGRRKSMTIACALYLVLPCLAIFIVSTGVKSLIVLGLILLGGMLGVGEGNNAAILPELFENRTRLASYALCYNLSAMTFGGLGPTIVQAIQNATDSYNISDYIPALYLTAIGVLVAACVWFVPETAGKQLRGTSQMELMEVVSKSGSTVSRRSLSVAFSESKGAAMTAGRPTDDVKLDKCEINTNKQKKCDYTVTLNNKRVNMAQSGADAISDDSY